MPEAFEIPILPRCIAAVGLEVEGGWHDRPSNLQGDGSVHEDLAAYTGEMVSRPFRTLKGACRWIERVWPDEMDSSCGFHIHYSFKLMRDYASLMAKQFTYWFLDELEKWRNELPNRAYTDYLSERIRGNNRYCRRDWRADDQWPWPYKNDHRYTTWNFCHGLHGTAECRVLPVFSHIPTAKRALVRVTELVDQWTREHTEPEIEAVVEAPDETPFVRSFERDVTCEHVWRYEQEVVAECV